MASQMPPRGPARISAVSFGSRTSGSFGLPVAITGWPRYPERPGPREAAMSRRKQDPLRELTADERREVTRLSRSQAAPAVEGIPAQPLLAVADRADSPPAAPPPRP